MTKPSPLRSLHAVVTLLLMCCVADGVDEQAVVRGQRELLREATANVTDEEPRRLLAELTDESRGAQPASLRRLQELALQALEQARLSVSLTDEQLAVCLATTRAAALALFLASDATLLHELVDRLHQAGPITAAWRASRDRRDDLLRLALLRLRDGDLDSATQLVGGIFRWTEETTASHPAVRRLQRRRRLDLIDACLAVATTAELRCRLEEVALATIPLDLDLRAWASRLERLAIESAPIGRPLSYQYWEQSILEAVRTTAADNWPPELRDVVRSAWSAYIRARRIADEAPTLEFQRELERIQRLVVLERLGGDKMPRVGDVPAELKRLAHGLKPRQSVEEAERLLEASVIACDASPGGTSWIDWANAAYRAQRVSKWSSATFDDRDVEAAQEWEGRASTAMREQVRLACMRERAAAWLRAGAKESIFLAIAAEELEELGDPVPADVLPRLDPASDDTLGMGADEIDRACSRFASAEGDEADEARRALLAAFHCYRQGERPDDQRIGGHLCRRLWHLGRNACLDLVRAAERRVEAAPLAVDVIAWLGGKHAEAFLPPLIDKLLLHERFPWDSCAAGLAYAVPAILEKRALSIVRATPIPGELLVCLLDGIGSVDRDEGAATIARLILDMDPSTRGWIHALRIAARRPATLPIERVFAAWDTFSWSRDKQVEVLECLPLLKDQRFAEWIHQRLASEADPKACEALLAACGRQRVISALPAVEALLTSERKRIAAQAALAMMACGRPPKVDEWLDGDLDDLRAVTAHAIRLADNQDASSLAWIVGNGAEFPRLCPQIVEALASTGRPSIVPVILQVIDMDPRLKGPLDDDRSRRVTRYRTALEHIGMSAAQRDSISLLLGRGDNADARYERR